MRPDLNAQSFGISVTLNVLPGIESLFITTKLCIRYNDRNCFSATKHSLLFLCRVYYYIYMCICILYISHRYIVFLRLLRFFLHLYTIIIYNYYKVLMKIIEDLNTIF